MQEKIFIGFRHISDIQDLNLKRITYEGKEYFGIIADKETLSLKEISSLAEAYGLDPHQVTLVPLLLFG